MQLGQLLIGLGLATSAQIEEALRHQLLNGRRLGENLISLGVVTEAQLTKAMNRVPAAPSSVAETGILPRNLVNLLLKMMYVESLSTVAELADRMKLPSRVIQTLIEDASQQRFIQAMGSVPGGGMFSIRYGLGERGREAARDALDQNLYIGPAPISLAAYQQQIESQQITNELVKVEALRDCLAGLIVPDHYIEKILPAINAGKTVLLFGPPGNGKTTMASRLGNIFRDVVYIPYAVDVNGQIMEVYDPSLHRTTMSDEALSRDSTVVEAMVFDERWVPCRRPFVMAGGELTLDMLDLQYNSDTKFYVAPLHVKALNGMLLIDDFGRQKFDPVNLLNRWIVPMENRIDYLKPRSGTSFSLPFDELVIFSTNLNPSDLMDPAFLRRIPYKIKLDAPTPEEYFQIFEDMARLHGLVLSKPVFDLVVDRLHGQFGLAHYQPKFICQQVVEASRCFGRTPELTREAAMAAMANLYYDIEDDAAAARLPPGAEPQLVSFA